MCQEPRCGEVCGCNIEFNAGIWGEPSFALPPPGALWRVFTMKTLDLPKHVTYGNDRQNEL